MDSEPGDKHYYAVDAEPSTRNGSPLEYTADARNNAYHDRDVFGHESHHDIKYKTLTWPVVTLLMIAEIVSNGMLSIPSAMATVGLAPGIILVVFLGMFATLTSYWLVRFKLNHPEGKLCGSHQVSSFIFHAFRIEECSPLML